MENNFYFTKVQLLGTCTWLEYFHFLLLYAFVGQILYFYFDFSCQLLCRLHTASTPICNRSTTYIFKIDNCNCDYSDYNDFYNHKNAKM